MHIALIFVILSQLLYKLRITDYMKSFSLHIMKTKYISHVVNQFSRNISVITVTIRHSSHLIQNGSILSEMWVPPVKQTYRNEKYEYFYECLTSDWLFSVASWIGVFPNLSSVSLAPSSSNHRTWSFFYFIETTRVTVSE